MNENLLNTLISEKAELRRQDKEIHARHAEMKANGATVTELNKVAREAQNIRADYNKVDSDLKNYQARYERMEEAKKKLDEAVSDESKVSAQIEYEAATEAFKTFENGLTEEYDPELEEEIKEESEETVKKQRGNGSRALAIILATVGAIGFLGAAHHACRDLNEKNAVVETDEDLDESETEEKPFEEYGNFTSAQDEEQIQKRAEWIYNTYLKDENNQGENSLTLEDVKNDIRLMNGQFMLDGGGYTNYNDTDIIAVANDLHTIANYDSFKKVGNCISYTPMAPFFTDGSLAQKAALEMDRNMIDVVTAIRADDKDAFVEAARIWGTSYVNIFNYCDLTGQHVSIRQVDAPSAFQLYHAINSKYASTILEYSERNHLNICIDYCEDYETGKTNEVALSEIMYEINEKPIDAVAVRSGNQEEYEANNLSLPEDLYQLAKDYYNSKYKLEMGASKTLK